MADKDTSDLFTEMSRNIVNAMGVILAICPKPSLALPDRVLIRN